MTALIINCTLKSSPEESNTESLSSVLAEALSERGFEVETVRAVDLDIRPGVSSDEGDGDEWPVLRDKIVAADIIVMATPTWLGQVSSVAKRVMERMLALLEETDDDGKPVCFDKVGGVVVTGNEDGAHRVIADVAQGLIDVGITVPGQAWTYWNRGPGPGPTYLDTDAGRDWSHKTARAAASNLVGVARALGANPLPAPPD